jgi:hypothetical protein
MEFEIEIELEIEIKIEIEAETEIEMEIEIGIGIEIEIESSEGGRCKHYKYCCQSKCECNHIGLVFGPNVWLRSTMMIVKVPSRMLRLSTSA